MAFDFPSAPSVGQSYQGYTWDGEKWVVAASGGKLARFVYIATAGQGTFSGADAAGNTLSYLLGALEVIVNGIHLPPADYTATDGTSITLSYSLSVGDYVYIQAFSNFSVLDALQKTLNGSDIPDRTAFRANLAVDRKNYIINGAMMVSQENGSTAVTTDQLYPADQWQWRNSTSAGVASAARVASLSPAGSPNRLRVTVTTVDTAITAGEFSMVTHIIEGYRIADLKSGTASAKTITIQFGVKAPAGTYCVSIRNSSTARSYVAEYTISAGEANTDVVKNVTLTLDTTGTWATDNSNGMYVCWALAIGSTYQTAAGSWAAGNFMGTANQFNLYGTNGNVFELFDVSITEGAVAPAFVVPDFISEFELCKRYWEKSYDYAVAPAAVSQVGEEIASLQMASATINLGSLPVRFKVSKRATPTITTYSPATGASGKLRDIQNNVDVTPTSVDHIGENGFRTFVTVTAAATMVISGHWTANARLT